MPVIDRTCTEDQMPAVAAEIAAALSATPFFCVWLSGEMGAGKTTLVRSILRALGLPEHEPVLSPTYTLMNDYEINGKWYAHLDLYRANNNLDLADIGALDAKNFRGIFLEWADAVHTTSQRLKPTHHIVCRYADNGARRQVQLESTNAKILNLPQR